MEKLIEIIENYSEAEEINESSNLKRDLELSSFDTVCMLADIESAFKITLGVKALAGSKTVGELFECIQAGIR